MAMIDFKTAPMEDINAHMASTEYGILDTTQLPKDTATGVFAVLPIVGYITGKNQNHSGEVIRDIITAEEKRWQAESKPPYFKSKLRKIKFNGFNQNRPSWSATLPVIFELIMVLSGKGAAEFRRTCAQYVVRVLAGDVSLIDKIEENNKAFSQTQEGRKVQEAMLSGVDPVLGKRARDDDMDRIRAEIELEKARAARAQAELQLRQLQLHGGIKRTGTWSEAFATFEPEEAQPFKLAYKGLGEGVQFNCFIAGCNNTFTNSRSYHQHIFRDHKNIPEGEKPHPDWPRSAFVIHKDDQKKTEADYFDRMSRFDPATKRWRMQCTNTEYWIEDIGHRLADTGEVCGQWFDSFSAYKNHQAERHARPKDFGKGLSRKYRCPKGCPGVFDTKAEEKAHWNACHTNSVCLHCGKRFKNRASLTKHQRSCLK